MQSTQIQSLCSMQLNESITFSTTVIIDKKKLIISSTINFHRQQSYDTTYHFVLQTYFLIYYQKTSILIFNVSF